jgi:hypothetical protein
MASPLPLRTLFLAAILFFPGCADPATATTSGARVPVAASVLNLRVTGAWSGEMASPRSLGCTPTGAYGGFEAVWAGTLGDRLVRLTIVDNSTYRYPGTVLLTGQDSSGAPQNPDIGIGLVEDTVFVQLLDLRTTDLHMPGGSLTVNPDRRSGSLDLRDRELRITGNWRC